MDIDVKTEAEQVLHEYFHKERGIDWRKEKIRIFFEGIIQAEFGLIIPFSFVSSVLVVPGGGRLLYDRLRRESFLIYVGQSDDELIVEHLTQSRIFVVKSLENSKKTALALHKAAKFDLKTSLAIANDSFLFAGCWAEIDCIRCAFDYYGLQSKVDVALEGQERKFPEEEFRTYRFYYRYPELIGPDLQARKFDPLTERGSIPNIEFVKRIY